MRVAKIEINQILGINHLEIIPGNKTKITGENGAGKTSILEAIRAALGGGHDATLLRQGAEKGEIVLMLEDGTQISKRITPDKSTLSVKHPDYGRLPNAASYIKKLADALSLNPVEFLTAGPKDRTNLLLQAIPMSVTADKLGFVPQIALEGIDLDKHALEVIGKIAKSIFDLRTGINRTAKEKKATANQMAETLPAEAPGGDWKTELDKALEESSALQRTTRNKLNSIDAVLQQAKADAHRERDEKISDVNRELEAAIEKLRTDAEIEINRLRQDCDGAIESAESEAKSKRNEEEAVYRPQEAALKERIGQAKAMVEQQSKAESTREFIAKLEKEAAGHEAESTKLTHALGQLETLKASLLENLPIGGLSVQDGEIYIGGIPWDRVNESRRIRIAIEIAKLRAGSLGLVLVDGLERLDPKSFEAFEKEAEKSKLQFVISRVSDGPLAIESEGAA